MTGKDDREDRLRSTEPCAICGKPALEAFAPFCSQRCADVDLGRWLGERYAIPGPETGEEPDEGGSH